MCGIAGLVDLRGEREVDGGLLRRMASAIEHRGPDEEGFLEEPGIGLASRRLSIVGLADGQQPIFNEDRSVAIVYNGELFDFREQRQTLEAQGHRFRTHCDTEVVVHLWEQYGEQMFEHLHGQFAFALYDFRRHQMILARDRVGICPLHYARHNGWFLFGSEIKAILASDLIERRPDPCGLDSMFTFFAMPTQRTAFAGIRSLLPGHYLKLQFRQGRTADVSDHQYWDYDFPDAGDEIDATDDRLVDEFRDIFFRAVDLRLRADVPVVGYLSGGVDSAVVVAAATKVRGAPIPSFTIKIASPRFDETDRALLNARTIGCNPTIVRCDNQALSDVYPMLVRAADNPVIDTACAALYRLANEVHRQGYKVALTGEGADEALAGYPWFKTKKLMELLDFGPIRPSGAIRRVIRAVAAPNQTWGELQSRYDAVGGRHAPADLYNLVTGTRNWFYGERMWSELAGYEAFADLPLDRERMRRWHPLNQSLYMGYKTILPGLLMNHKGDRVAMASSVETRFPFLDENVINFCAKVHPRWKLRRILRDKHLLRTMAKDLLPKKVASRPKAMFRAPFADTFFAEPPAYVDQLLSEESLRKTGYFNPRQVIGMRNGYRTTSLLSGRRLFVEMGLTGVMATQLWHHLYLGGGLCELPVWTPPAQESLVGC